MVPQPEPLFAIGQEVAVTVKITGQPCDLVGTIRHSYHSSVTGRYRYRIAIPGIPAVWVDERDVRGVQAALPLEAPAE